MRVSFSGVAKVLVLAAVEVCLAAQVPEQPGKAAMQKESVTPSAEDKRKALEADVERLVQLAKQMKGELEHIRQDELSLKVLREADEIDRLARSTRTRIH